MLVLYRSAGTTLFRRIFVRKQKHMDTASRAPVSSPLNVEAPTLRFVLALNTATYPHSHRALFPAWPTLTINKILVEASAAQMQLRHPSNLSASLGPQESS